MPNPLNPIFRQPRESSQQRPKGLSQGGKLKFASKKRSVQLKAYTKLRADYILHHPYCKPCEDRNVLSLTKEIHHKSHREGAKLNDVKDWLPCCVECHRAIHHRPALARALGYLK